MKFLPSNRISPFNLPGAPASPTIEVKPAEIQQILKRLRILLESHRAVANRMQSPLNPADILAVIDALLAEADRRDPKPFLKCSDPIREYLRCSLYDEWLGEPSNVLYTTPISPETTRYEAMPREVWTTCLNALREDIESSPSPSPS